MSGARPDTWMPWYIGDYLRKTMHLDHIEDGAYRRLIDATWVRGGELDASDKEKATIAKLPLKAWLAIKPTIAKFFEVDGHVWRHGRISEELAKAEAIVSARSAGAKRTNERRWGDQSATRSATDERPGELPLTVSPMDRPSPSPSPSSSLRSEEKDLLLEFENSWWPIYPRKVARGKALKAFVKARKTATLQQLINGAKRYAATADPNFTAHAATWLNDQRWLDEPGGALNGHDVSEPSRPDAPPDPRDLEPLND